MHPFRSTLVITSLVVLLCHGSLPAAEPELLRLPPITSDISPAQYQTPPTEYPQPLPPPQIQEPDAFSYGPVEEVIVSSEAGMADEELILPMDTVEEMPVYSWYDIRTWADEAEWELSFELGINGTAGNSETFSQVAGVDAKRVYDVHTWRFNALYNQSSAGSVETANNALGQLRYERALGESRWSLFSNSTLEYDAFRDYDMRVATNGGFGYQLIDLEKTKLKGRFGAGASQEIGGPDNEVVPEAVFGFDLEHHFREGSKLTCETDYLPQWNDFSDYRINTIAGWEMPIDSLLNLSMKIAIINRYDNTPYSRKPNDLTYSLLFLWKPL